MRRRTRQSSSIARKYEVFGVSILSILAIYIVWTTYIRNLATKSTPKTTTESSSSSLTNYTAVIADLQRQLSLAKRRARDATPPPPPPPPPQTPPTPVRCKPAASNSTMRRKPRVAVCYWGLTRTTKYVYKTHRAHILYPLTRHGFEYDVFMHTWRLEGRQNYGTRYMNASLDYQEYKLLDPLEYVIENEEEFKKSLNMKLYYYNGTPEWDYTLLVNTLCSLRSQKRVTEMVEASGRAYDYYMYIRPDLNFSADFDASRIATMQKKGVILPNSDSFEGFNDRFAVLAAGDAAAYGKRIDGLPEYRRRVGYIVAERYLRYIVDRYLRPLLVTFTTDLAREWKIMGLPP